METAEQTFLSQVARLLEVPSVTPETDFRAGPLWDSLTAFALRVLLDQKYDRAVSAAELQSCRTVSDLMKLAGVKS